MSTEKTPARKWRPYTQIFEVGSTSVISVRLTPAQRERFSVVAKARGFKHDSELVRELILAYSEEPDGKVSKRKGK